MKIKSILAALFLSAGLMAFVTACSGDNKDPKDNAEAVNDARFDKDGEKAADKLVEAYTGNLYEIRASENAALNAVTPEVKKLAMMLVEAHTKMNADVKHLADSKQVSLPSDLSSEQVQKMEELTDKTGMAYDKEFTEQMKHKHEHAVEFYEKTADKCGDTEIRSWANATLAEVRSHLDMVMSVHNLVKDMK